MKSIKIVAVTAVAFVAGAFYCSMAHAMLFCWNSSNNVAMTYQNGAFVYQLENGTQPPPVVANPGPQLLPEYYSNAYCWADGAELTQLFQALPDLRYPSVSHGTFRKSLQHPLDGIVYFTGDDAWSIINDF